MQSFERCLVYGASGYTGELIAELAKERGVAPILAGRSENKVRPLAERLGMPMRTFSLDDPSEVDRGLADVDVVIHAAGPFSQTSKPMVDACLRTKTHYLDITGEVDVFEACAARDAEAQKAGVMLMPGTGFDVVPSDCLAKHVADRLPGATHLVLAIATIGGRPSHGTAATMVEGLDRPNLVRKDGELSPVRAGKLKRTFDFGQGPKATLAIPWGDVSTAYRSTKIPNIEVYMALPKGAMMGASVLGFAGKAIGSGAKRMIKARIAEGGPSKEERKTAFNVLIGEVSRGEERRRTRLRVGEGYELTAAASLAIADRVLAGGAEPGYRTPAMLLGADFILQFEGAERTDLD
jgi:short subunit dehydrogenase-like uncharacterized protein